MESATAWFEKLSALHEEGCPCAVVVVTDVKGSVPRERGARMIIADGEVVWGTIGGGKLEHLAIEHARELLTGAASRSETIDYPLAESAGQCCGGSVTLFFETFPWTARPVVVFGAGHVAQALAGLQPYLATDMRLIDSRDESEIHPKVPPDRTWELICVDCPEEEVEELSPHSLVLIMTHDHALDLLILERVLQRGCFPYVGLIGSTRKWQRFKQRLEQRGFGADAIDSVTCPIGRSKTSKEPAAIAISAAADLLEVIAAVEAG